MPPEDRPATTIDLSWLIALRWAAIAGQLVTILGVELTLDLDLPWPALAALIATEAATNAAAQSLIRRREDVPGAVPFAILAVDVIVLTGLLYFTGGPHNPFNFLYLVYIALAAVVLRPAESWALAGLSVAAFGGLFLQHVPLAGLGGMDHGGHAHHAGGPDPMDLHLRGMWVAFAVGALFIVYFVTRVTRALAEREAALHRAREAAASTERLASLATLAAGAAHELATPLGTIAVVARELELELEGRPEADDARVIRSQVKRCRGVLDQLAVDAGRSRGESDGHLTVGALLDTAMEGLPTSRVVCSVPESTRELPIPGYRSALSQMVRAVVRNGLDATGGEGPVHVLVQPQDSGVRLRVRDAGAGMDEDTLRRATEPFFTTKETAGMGLGLFLARTTLERLGGTLEIESSPDTGTTVDLCLPSR